MNRVIKMETLRVRPSDRDDSLSEDSRLEGSDPDLAVARRPILMLRLAQVAAKTGMGKTTIYELQKQGRFPRSVHLTSHCVRWIEAEIETWLAQHANGRNAVRDKAKVRT